MRYYQLRGAETFVTTDTKLDVLVAIQDDAKLLQELKSVLKRATNWKRYQSKVTTQTQNQYLGYLTDPSFHFFCHMKIMTGR